MKVLHLNIRRNHGGSSVFMNNLGRATEELGIKNQYFALTKDDFIFYLDDQPSLIPYFNFISHKFFGKDLFTISKQVLQKRVQTSDIIHLHVIHSHYINYLELFKIIKFHQKPVVVTLHDKWYFTGRCAIPLECSENKNFCRICPDKKIYPASLSGNTFTPIQEKFSIYRNLKQKIVFVSPSEWIKNSIENMFPEFKIRHITNGINIRKTVGFPVSKENNNLIFITNDFRDGNKVNLPLLKKIIDLNYGITLVGKNQPLIHGGNVTGINRGITNDNVQEKLRNFKCFLLMSRFENYPTILIEALVNGCCVLTTKNKGAIEILKPYTYGKDYLFVEDMNKEDIDKMFNYNNQEVFSNRREFSINFFNISMTAKKYSNLYKEILQK